MPPTDREPWVPAFVGHLQRLLGANPDHRDAGTLAKLRRGLTNHPGERDTWVYAHLVGARPEHEAAAALVASLFALWHQGGRVPPHQCPGTLGGSYGRLRAGAESAAEKRFAILIDSHPDDLPVRLRHAVTLLRSKDVGIAWVQLLRDLLRWEDDRRPVQRQWAREFWAARTTEAV